MASISSRGGSPSGSSVASLTPTATKTGAYTVAVGEIAMMNVPGGATALTLPAAPADKAQVGYRAIGATTAVPLVITRGGTDTIGTAGATTASIPLADEVAVLQYDAPNTRWLAVANVKTQVSLDSRYSRTVSSVAYAATVTPALGGADTVLNIGTLTGNLTIANPTGTPADGQHLTLRLVQDATGSRTYTFGTAYAFGSDISSGLLPTTASAKFEVIFQYNATDSKWRAVGLVRGF